MLKLVIEGVQVCKLVLRVYRFINYFFEGVWVYKQLLEGTVHDKVNPTVTTFICLSLISLYGLLASCSALH